MAIIYTYPVKTDPVAADKVLISDSEDNNKTKSVTIEDIRSGTVSGVSSILAGNNVTISPGGGTGNVTVNATAYTAGDGIDITAYAVSADVKANSGITIDGTEISLDLSASAIEGTLAVEDGGTGADTFTAGFLRANGASAFTTQSQIDLTSQVADTLSIANGGTGEISRQEAIDSLTNASTATSGHVLTSDGTNASFSQFNLSNAAGTLAVGSGGTGASTFTAGFLKANGTNAFTTAANIDLTADVTNTLPVSNGGTGLNTIAAGFVTRGNGTNAVVADAYLQYEGNSKSLKIRGIGNTAPSLSCTLGINDAQGPDANKTACIGLTPFNGSLQGAKGMHIDLGAFTEGIQVFRNDTNATIAMKFQQTLSGPTPAQVGSITISNSATAYNTSSDHRLKENVVDMTGAVDRVKQLLPKRFNFTSDPEVIVDGFLAHEAQTVVPESVTGTRDEIDADGNPVYQGIDQSKLVPLLVGAIKELTARIEALEA